MRIVRKLVGLVLALSLPAQVTAQESPQDEPGDKAVAAIPGGAAQTGSEVDAPLSGDRFYCGERKLGTWFYCDRPKPRKTRTAQAQPAATSAAQLADIGRELEELKARAILEPSEENVSAFIRFQREQLDRASTFSDQWQRVMWQNPELDYTLQRPVSTLAKRAWIDNRREDIDGVMRRLSQRYGIFYFYAQSCGACDVFAPILKSLADSSGFNVVAVSMDGGPNKTFPDYVVDAGQYQRMGLTSKATPALVLYDTARRRPIPIGTGIMSMDEIKQRIFVLTETQVGSDF